MEFEKPTKQVQKKQKIRFMGRFKRIELWIPLDVSKNHLFKNTESLKIFKSIQLFLDESNQLPERSSHPRYYRS